MATAVDVGRLLVVAVAKRVVNLRVYHPVMSIAPDQVVLLAGKVVAMAQYKVVPQVLFVVVNVV